MNPRSRTKARGVLLVEGPDDQHVLWALLKHHQVPQTFDILPTGGVDALVQNMGTRLKARIGEEEQTGVVLDADVHLEQRWQSVSDALRAATGVGLPAVPDPTGTLVTLPDGRIFGIWVMPNNQTAGNLEDFLLFLRPECDTLLPHVDAFLDGLPSKESCPHRFAEKDWTKARLHGYLAIQEEPGKPLGLAITCRYLDADAPSASQLIGWIRRIFVQSP